MSGSYYGNLARKQMKDSLNTGKTTTVELKRATYYLRPDQIRALKLRAVLSDETISTIVRAALDEYLASKKSRPERSPKRADDFLFCSS